MIEITIPIYEFVGLLSPDAHHLGGLLFEGHLAQEILHSLSGRKISVLVRGRCFAARRGRCGLFLHDNDSSGLQAFIATTSEHKASEQEGQMTRGCVRAERVGRAVFTGCFSREFNV
jgi:hypothetical protein